MKLKNGKKEFDEKSYVKQIKINMIFNNVKQKNLLVIAFITVKLV